MLLNYIKRSQLYFIGSFAALILVGTLLLKMPWVAYRPNGIPTALSWIDACFTATSAVCVTGLTVVNTGDFNWFGQLTILVLLQLGGLGIMTLSASIVIFLGRGMSFGNTMMLANLNENFSLRNTESLIRTIIWFVLCLEAAGAFFLFLAFWLTGMENWYMSIYMGVFHSISAFCNAGFSPYSDSLCRAPGIVKLLVALMIIVGGIGWYVYYDLSHLKENNRGLRLHSKVVLWMTGILIGGGMVGIWYFEMSGSNGIAWIDALFQSVTARTAGFNSVPLVDQVTAQGPVSGLTPNSMTLLIVLMLIGASPGSTGGGIKVVAVALAAMAIINTIKGNRSVLIYKREIPISYVLKSFTIICTFLVLATIGAVMLANRAGEDVNAQYAYFESVSALSTVGLSSGVTATANTAGKLVLIGLMFVGRIGPFTMLLFLLGREKESRLQYPEERVILG